MDGVIYTTTFWSLSLCFAGILSAESAQRLRAHRLRREEAGSHDNTMKLKRGLVQWLPTIKWMGSSARRWTGHRGQHLICMHYPYCDDTMLFEYQQRVPLKKKNNLWKYCKWSDCSPVMLSHVVNISKDSQTPACCTQHPNTAWCSDACHHFAKYNQLFQCHRYNWQVYALYPQIKLQDLCMVQIYIIFVAVGQQ